MMQEATELSASTEIMNRWQQVMGNLQFTNVAQAVAIEGLQAENERLKAQIAELEARPESLDIMAKKDLERIPVDGRSQHVQ